MNHFSKLITGLVWMSVLLTACGNASVRLAESTKHRETNPNVQTADLGALVDGNNTFALDIYRSLRGEDGNLILSPFSMSLALAMTYAGARGDTEAQMAEVMNFNLPQAQLHSAFNSLDLALEKSGASLDETQEPMQLKIANAVWAEQTHPFAQEFLDIIAVNYGAGIHLADFINQFEAERKSINDWVSDRTEDRIQDLVPQGALNSDTRMVLVNAIYFKADWFSPFDVDSTYDAPFHLLDGSEVTVPTMHEGMFVPYMQGDGFQAVELAYAGQTTAMDIILPDEGNFETFDSSFNRDVYDQIIHGMQPTSLQLALPKFKFDKDFNLTDTLKGMGMTDAFEGSLADFSGMTGKKDLFISNVVHKAFVAVDEEGTEAAAATAVIMETAGAPMLDMVLQVDRPFIFIIRDTANGQILFIGRVTNPTP
jgi:serpin B